MCSYLFSVFFFFICFHRNNKIRMYKKNVCKTTMAKGFILISLYTSRGLGETLQNEIRAHSHFFISHFVSYRIVKLVETVNVFLRCIFCDFPLTFYVHLLDYPLPTHIQSVPLPYGRLVDSRLSLSHLIIITWSAFRSLILVKRSNRSREERKLNCFHIRFTFPYPFLFQHIHTSVLCVCVWFGHSGGTRE